MQTHSHSTIALGAGCFWCSEAVFVQVRGVLDVESGYSNGHVPQPRYEDVCSGASGHNEVIKLVFDPAQISLREILEIMFLIHDPTSLNRQGNDVGPQYRSGIYCSDAAQLAEVQAFMVGKGSVSGGTIASGLTMAGAPGSSRMNDPLFLVPKDAVSSVVGSSDFSFPTRTPK